ncbi:uncharacterized protein LOC132039081 [Lycium ferocissimum]|uniref:uncharacterized protein LOC132039081 n=1 Tax=Lycium ferocissimum TaxID=112874 RepID=UPI002815C9FE|nr:uncharacterized protein LOC132039081 [Lycium ferocissimum]
MIAQVLLKDVAETPWIPIKDCIINVKQEGSFKTLPRYMAALQKFNAGTVVEWRLQGGTIFNYVFWAFKPSIDGFGHWRPVISIDGMHVYGTYDIKLLIAVGMDANG